jgi:radical SAM superfamily enzyme YgiQ (UPF0313 family)
MGRLPPTVPLGLALVGAAVERAGHSVAFHDDYLEQGGPGLMARRINEVQPDLIGLHVNLTLLSSARELIAVAKARSIPTVIGGPQVTLDPTQTLRCTGATYAVVGEGEETLPELCSALAAGGDKALVNSVLSLCYTRASGGGCVFTGLRQPMLDLDNVPFVPLHLFPLGRYDRRGNEAGCSPCDMISTSRGCPFNCRFCSNKAVWGRRYRFMSARRVVDEVIHLKQNYGTKGVYFREDHFTLRRDRLIEVCKLLVEAEVHVRWVCESRVDRLDEESVALMRRAGCRAVWFGVESGTQRVLDMLNKQTRLEQIEAVFRLLKKHRIAAGASVMLGIPGQTMEENSETIRFLHKLDPDWVYFNTFVGLPGSEMYDEILEQGLVWKEWEGLVLPNSEVMTWPEKQAFKRRAELAFNLRPKMLLRHLRRMGPGGLLRKGANVLSRYRAGVKFEHRQERQGSASPD